MYCAVFSHSPVLAPLPLIPGSLPQVYTAEYLSSVQPVHRNPAKASQGALGSAG